MRILRAPVLVVSVISSALFLQGCGQSSDHAEKKAEIKAAPKLTNDATTYAHEAWRFMNEADPYVYRKQRNLIEENVRKPARKLSTEWRINVKMTDSVTEGKYALCRKALTSLDVWARETMENSATVSQTKADYERDKAQCKDALEHPELGNTDPKKKAFSS